MHRSYRCASKIFETLTSRYSLNTATCRRPIVTRTPAESKTHSSCELHRRKKEIETARVIVRWDIAPWWIWLVNKALINDSISGESAGGGSVCGKGNSGNSATRINKNKRKRKEQVAANRRRSVLRSAICVRHVNYRHGLINPPGTDLLSTSTCFAELHSTIATSADVNKRNTAAQVPKKVSPARKRKLNDR